MIVVASIPHSGTRFVIDHLLSGYVRQGEVPTDGGGYFVQHPEYRYQSMLRNLACRHDCIVPIRHPYLVAQSWVSRRSNNPEYYDLERMVRMYQWIINELDPLDPYYLPVDLAKTRQQWLDAINEGIGLNLKTDWPVIGSCNKHSQLEGDDLHIVGQFVAETSEFFKRFGYLRTFNWRNIFKAL